MAYAIEATGSFYHGTRADLAVSDLLLEQQALDSGYLVVATDERAARQHEVGGWWLGSLYLARIAVDAVVDFCRVGLGKRRGKMWSI